MTPPESTEIFETSTGKYWFDQGILYVVTKRGIEPDLETHKQQMQELKNRAGNKKMCAIMEVGESTPTSKAIRDYNEKELPHLFKAIAFIIKNPLARMVANIYLGVKAVPFPVKMTASEEEAKMWIREHTEFDR